MQNRAQDEPEDVEPEDVEPRVGESRGLNEIRGELENLWREWRRLQSTRSASATDQASHEL